jgi:PEGA domain
VIGVPPSKRWLVLLVAAACLTFPFSLRAETAVERLDRAKGLFREGNALLQAGDPERALERFLQSRELVPSGKNTANAAICLQRLGRNDEALEMYEELLSRFAADIDEQDRQNLAPSMAQLRRGLGNLEISANVDGLVTVDGRPRGRLPRVTALRVVPGKRRIRVVREGYQSFDRVVEVSAGATQTVDAFLEPLAGTGAVRVELTGGATGQVFVDGKPRGEAPWEGTLKPGLHQLQVLGPETGSKPENLEVLEGKTLLVRVSSSRLGPTLRLFAEPKTARLSLDGVDVGVGSWWGRLPVGTHALRGTEPGYFDYQRALNIGPFEPAHTLRVDLKRDPSHPRWPHRFPWRFGLGLNLGLAYAPTLHGGQESLCPGLCSGSTAAFGGKLEVAPQLLHDRGLGVELGFGYLLARQTFSRAAFASYAAARVTYALEQEMLMGGFFGRAAAVAVMELGKKFGLRTSVGAGLMRAVYEARSDGAAWTTGAPAAASGSGLEPISEMAPIVTTSISLERALGPVGISLGVSAWFFPTRGPTFSDAELAPTPSGCEATSPDFIGCAPASGVLATEPVHGPFWLLSPELAARYRF